TLRQRLARFVRQTLSFSKSDVMHEICLRLFLHRYNLSFVSPG
ncbi:MAG TPA: IS1 family transposase, partial [Blastocatellia bacterium]|nr:IS1 family transposase [Blastocatellia bacterium]HZS03762.1 IS1 family transposase [Blastocatellia bacterium]HZS03779.1 IS1 family transposase [Blastocatellia bacterium]HZS03783.1 IS1 family transposase [Blastocatellia bacterium]HZS04602.1 IS1 family transposase [Blastocatellia bacterium]